MINFDQMNRIAAEQFGELASNQKSAIKNYIDGSLSEKKLFEKLGTNEKKFSAFLKSVGDGRR